MDIRMQANTGLRYYKTQNDIKKRKKYIYYQDTLIVDPYSANNTIASAFYPLIVDQKVDYLLGKKPTMTVDNDKFYQDLINVARKASAQGIQWAYPYVRNGELELALFPTAELKWFYDDNEDLKEMWRHVEDEDGNKWVYVYDAEGIRVYRGKVEGEPYKTMGHVSVTAQMGTEEVTEQESWGVCPFIPMKNNVECVYDLEPIKGLIDSYDIILSDFANNLEDFQDVMWVLKGYNGQDLGEFLNDVRMYKTMVVGEGGDARPETIDIPTEAREKMLDRNSGLIFKFGRGVDTEKLAGGSLTNVAIEAHFTNLDMKANNFSYQVTEFINKYIEFYNIFAEKSGKERLEEGEVVYNKTMIVNEDDALKSNVEQTGNVSKRTQLLKHPWDLDPDEEMDQMKKERESEVDSLDTPFEE